MNIILASGSPRRKELLGYITKDFEVIVSNADESFKEGLTIQEQSKRIAYLKAKEVFDKTTGDRIIIGSDTLVLKNGKHYGKPKDKQEAFKMISELQNDVHEVITSLCVIIEKDGKKDVITDYDITRVYLSKIDEKEINEWIESGEAMDKAGAYAIQGQFSKFIVKFEGSYNSVVGLPVQKLYQIIKKYIEVEK